MKNSTNSDTRIKKLEEKVKVLEKTIEDLHVHKFVCVNSWVSVCWCGAFGFALLKHMERKYLNALKSPSLKLDKTSYCPYFAPSIP
jgi:hypothetical protein